MTAPFVDTDPASIELLNDDETLGASFYQNAAPSAAAILETLAVDG